MGTARATRLAIWEAPCEVAGRAVFPWGLAIDFPQSRYRNNRANVVFSGSVASQISPKRLIAAACMLAALAACLLIADLALGGAAKVIGSKDNPKPSCPTPSKDVYPAAKQCLGVNTVTAFQTKAGGKGGTSKVPANGAIVAWSVDLARPSEEEVNFFDDAFGGGSTARLSILKAQGKGRYTLTKQSPRVDLTASAGREPIFTLKKPLKVKKGLTVALTTETWLANFAHDGKLTSSGDRWRASRLKKRCGDDPQKSPQENEDDIFKSKPHTNKGSTRTYGCIYDSARVLYSAYFAPEKRDGGGKGGGKEPGQNG